MFSILIKIKKKLLKERQPTVKDLINGLNQLGFWRNFDINVPFNKIEVGQVYENVKLVGYIPVEVTSKSNRSVMGVNWNKIKYHSQLAITYEVESTNPTLTICKLLSQTIGLLV